MSQSKELVLLIKAHRRFNQILRGMANKHSEIEVIDQLIDLIEELFPTRMGSLLLVDQQTQTLHLSAAKTKLPPFYNQAIDGLPLGADIGSCGAAAFLKTPYIVSDIQTHPNWQPFIAIAQQAALGACWSMPVFSKQNIVLATFAIYSPIFSEPSDYELEILESAANIASIALDKSHYFK